LKIRHATENDITNILQVHLVAFGENAGQEIYELVNAMFQDETAMPMHSFVAEENGKIVGHVLFSHIQVIGENEKIAAQILAPLAVLPTYQNQGIGRTLIKTGLEKLKELGITLVFVLGYPDYYSRFGFKTAGKRGFEAPHPILEKNADAWMVQALQEDAIEKNSGKIQCSTVLGQPQYWQE